MFNTRYGMIDSFFMEGILWYMKSHYSSEFLLFIQRTVQKSCVMRLQHGAQIFLSTAYFPIKFGAWCAPGLLSICSSQVKSATAMKIVGCWLGEWSGVLLLLSSGEIVIALSRSCDSGLSQIFALYSPSYWCCICNILLVNKDDSLE